MFSAFQVTNPLALLALASLLIPLLIHLFNRSRGRLVRIGHIDLIRQARKLRVTEVRMSQWLLLLVRLIIFTLLTLLLAGLLYSNPATRQNASLYISPDWLASAGDNELDQLMAVSESLPGARIQLLTPAFPDVDEDTLRNFEKSDIQNVNIWPLLLETLDQERHAGPVHVFTTDASGQFGEHMPALPTDINWHLLEKRETTPETVRSYHATIVYDKGREDEAIRLDYALGLIRQYRLPGLVWERVASDRPESSLPASDWWLMLTDGIPLPNGSDKQLTPRLVLSIPAARALETDLQYLALPFYPYTQFSLQRRSQKPSSLPNAGDTMEWQPLLASHDGSPLLMQATIGPTRYIQFASRLDPSWNSLISQASFPEALLELLLGHAEQRHRYSGASVNPDQLPQTAMAATASGTHQAKPLHYLLAALLLCFWILERWLSERRLDESR